MTDSPIPDWERYLLSGDREAYKRAFGHYPPEANTDRLAAENAALRAQIQQTQAQALLARPRVAANRKRPIRSVGVREELWTPAVDKARANGETIADVIERALKRYLRT